MLNVVAEVVEYPCIVWKGYRQRDGYGVFSQFQGKMVLAHRKSYETWRGSIQEGELVLHKCDNPPCIESTHLYVGTHDDNQTEKKLKGRAWRPAGDSNGRALITNDEARLYKELLDDPARDCSISELARFLGISRYILHDIKRGKNWKDIPEI